MAKAKAKAKKVWKKAGKRKPGSLPEGYKVIGRAPSWDLAKYPVIEGPRGETTEIEMPKKKGEKKARTVRTFVLQDETIGAVAVWESSMLRDAFDQSEDGDILRIEFLGYGEAKKGQNAPKLFNVMKKEAD